MTVQRKPEPQEGYFTLDRAWMREQAREAIKTFFAPLAGVYAAFTAPLSDRRD